MEQTKLTGYPSIDKPWLKYYSKEAERITIPECSFYEDMYLHSRHRSGIAFEYMGLKTSYRKMFYMIDKAAKAFIAVGVHAGDIVSVCLPNIPEVIYVLYAINKIGAIANMLDPRSGEADLRDALVDGESVVLVILDSVADKFNTIYSRTPLKKVITVSAIQSLPAIVQSILRITDRSLRRRGPKHFITWNKFIQMGRTISSVAPVNCDSNADAVIAYTGGTTGVPKGVIATNRNINAVVEMEKIVGFCNWEGERLLDIAPPWTYYGLCNSLHISLCFGICAVLIPKLGADELGKVVQKWKPNHVITVPSALFAVINDEHSSVQDYSFLKTIVVGADKLDESLEQQVNAFLRNHGSNAIVTKGYGMTEVMAAAAYTKTECDGIGSVGVPYPGILISAFVENNGIMRECKTGEIGELAIHGPTMMRGYFGKAAPETTEVIKVHADGTAWVHTGDLGYIDKDARIYIEGRIKRMFVANGYKVFPGSIEHCLMEHPLIKQAAVVPVHNSVVGNHIHAYIVLARKESIDVLARKESIDQLKEDLSTMLREKLYDYELPNSYEFVNEFPLTLMGKIDYRALEERAAKEYLEK